MHKALYREYRPISFEDVVGQDYIVKTLENQIKNDSLSHAYLFCGTRGTGKTTTAKILSRAVNCISDNHIKPCNECEICKSILDGSNLDVIEIDAASNNSVDDVRELRERVKYTPNNSRYKVYIIDEVHMLTQGAFNALLKTLEEPPPFVIFMLATTEPNKIPATILSRCQRFDFKRVAINTLVEKMTDICKKEGIEIEEQALKIIARNGQGSVRDSLSILDKCVSFGEKKIEAGDVLNILGSTDPQQLIEFSKTIIYKDVCKSISIIDDYFMWGKDLSILVQDVTVLFRSIMMAKVFSSTEDIVDFDKEEAEEIMRMSQGIDMEEVIHILNVLSELSSNIRYSSNPRLTFEIYIMKLSSPETDNSVESLVSRLGKLEKIVEDGKINIVLNGNFNQGQIISNQSIEANSTAVESEPSSNINRDGLINTNTNSIQSGLGAEVNMNPIIADGGIVTDSDELRAEDGDAAKLNIIKSRWKLLLERLDKDKKKPIKVFLSEVLDFRIKDENLLIVIGDGFSFAIPKLNDENNMKYFRENISNIVGFDVVPKFVVLSDVVDDASKNYNDNSTENFLKSKLGEALKIE